MKRWLMSVSLLVVCISGGTYFATDSQAQDTAVANYVVQYGDTLWDIAGAYLNSPYRWREIHQTNSFITNPNLIYPGEVLNLQGIAQGMPAGNAQGTAQTSGKKRSNKVIARPWYGVPIPEAEAVPSLVSSYPIVPSNDFIESNGYIVPYTINELETAHFGQITGVQSGEGENNTQIIRSENGQPGLVFGDNIYINRGSAQNIREGDVFLAFQPVREIQHPLTKEIMGTQIMVLGRLRIKTLEPDISCAEIIKSYSYMEIGSPIMPVSELSLPIEKPMLGNSRSYGFKVGNQLVGHIIAERVNRIGISFGDIVFIDVGAAQGVQPADNFIIFREIGEGYPRQAIGRLTVLSTQKQTSTALITESVKEIELAEKIVLMR